MDSTDAVNNSQVIASWALVVFTLLLAYVTWRYAKATKGLESMSENQVLLQLSQVHEQIAQLRLELLRLRSDSQLKPIYELTQKYVDQISDLVRSLTALVLQDMVVQPKSIPGLCHRLRSLVRWICIGQMPSKHTHLHTLIKWMYGGEIDDNQ